MYDEAKASADNANKPAAKQGKWKKGSKGWWYEYTDKSYAKSGLVKIDDVTYYFNGNGWMQTGWVKSGSDWYYFAGSGAMQSNKWIQHRGSWYWVDANGVMATDQWVDSGKYYVDGEGKWIANANR